MSEAILLRIVEGARVALYRANGDTDAEIVPSRIDLHQYSGGYGWGYGGSGPNNLSFAVAAKIFEFDRLSNDLLGERATRLLERVFSHLHGDMEHDLPVQSLRHMAVAAEQAC